MKSRCLVAGALLLGLSSFAAAEDVVWTNAVGVSVSGSTLTKTSGEAWGNAGAASVNVIDGGYGYAEFTVPDTSKSTIIGLSYGDSTQDWPDIDFGIHPQAGGALFVYEAGSGRGSFGSYAGGDRLRVEVYHGVVRYLRNGAVFYTST